MIEVTGLHKKLSNQEVLKNINLAIPSKTIFGIIGENGAGKTTLIKCLTGIYRPEQGSAKILNQEVYENSLVKEKIGYVADQNQYFPSFRISELVTLYGLSYPAFSPDRFRIIREKFQLSQDKRVKDLSKGMQMRLALALNLSIYPQVLLLDEPTSGLDPVAKKEVTNLLLEEVETRGVTIFISSHHLGDLERICDSIGIIRNGEIVYVNSLEQMKRNIKKLQVVFREDPPEDINQWPEIMWVEKIGRVHYLVTKEYPVGLENRLRGTEPLLLEEVGLSLEDMFIYSTKEGLKNGSIFL